MIEVAVYGARGYQGRTLVGLLSDHSEVETILPVSTTVAGRAYGDEVPSLGHLDTTFVEPGSDALGADVVFLATGSEDAEEALEEIQARSSTDDVLVVDLSRAHRADAIAGDDVWSYGHPEAPEPLGAGEGWVANPGCYPTASLIALGPALAWDLSGPGPIVVDAKSGISGAGATPRADLHFPEANESLRAYGVEGHDHQEEIQAAVAQIEASKPEQARPVRFTPHLVPQTRGLLATAYLPLADGVSQAEVQRVYEKAYGTEPFVETVGEPDTTHVTASNRAQVGVTVDAEAGLLVARCTIDNLVKGGAGTAVQNLNEVLGFDPAAGLPLKGVSP